MRLIMTYLRRKLQPRMTQFVKSSTRSRAGDMTALETRFSNMCQMTGKVVIMPSYLLVEAMPIFEREPQQS